MKGWVLSAYFLMAAMVTHATGSNYVYDDVDLLPDQLDSEINSPFMPAQHGTTPVDNPEMATQIAEVAAQFKEAVGESLEAAWLAREAAIGDAIRKFSARVREVQEAYVGEATKFRSMPGPAAQEFIRQTDDTRRAMDEFAHRAGLEPVDPNLVGGVTPAPVVSEPQHPHPAPHHRHRGLGEGKGRRRRRERKHRRGGGSLHKHGSGVAAGSMAQSRARGN